MQTTPNYGLLIPNADTDAFDELAYSNALVKLDALGVLSKTRTSAAVLTVTATVMTALDTVGLRHSVTIPAAAGGLIDVLLLASLGAVTTPASGRMRLGFMRDGVSLGNAARTGSGGGDGPILVYWRDTNRPAGTYAYDLAAWVGPSAATIDGSEEPTRFDAITVLKAA